MYHFWRLFTSDYVQDLVVSVSMPTGNELIQKIKGSQFELGVDTYKQKVKDFIKQIPSFGQFIARVIDPTSDSKGLVSINLASNKLLPESGLEITQELALA